MGRKGKGRKESGGWGGGVREGGFRGREGWRGGEGKGEEGRYRVQGGEGRIERERKGGEEKE